MADMNNKEMSNNYQNNGPNKDEIEIVDMSEHHVEHESPVIAHSRSPSQSYDQVDDVMVDIQAMLRDSEESPLSTRSCCIYRVPHVIRQVNEDAYTPQVVSIGPLHYGTPRLQNMERHKQVLFKEFIEQSNTSLDDLVNLVKSSERRVRACYSENIELSRKELVKLILLDAGFIIVLFLGWLEEDSYLKIPCLRFDLEMDLLLLENQLPFFILEELFNQAIPSHIFHDCPSFLNLTFDFFSNFNLQKLDPNPIKHFTYLFRNFHLNPHIMPSFDAPKNYELLYTANELYEAGVKFKKRTSNCLLDLKFSGCILEIPKISIEDPTELIFRNMIAFEQLQYPYEPYIANYVKVLDYLINTSKDVDILIHQEIISNYLADSNDVAQLFNGLGKNILFVNFNSEYADICKRLNVFHKDPWNNMKATLRRDYCKTPWQIVASIAGIVLLILTVVQTIFSVIK